MMRSCIVEIDWQRTASRWSRFFKHWHAALQTATWIYCRHLLEKRWAVRFKDYTGV